MAVTAIVEVPENRLALRAVRRLGRRAAAPFHPLLLHGPPGTGKTALAESLLRRVSRAGHTARTLPANDWDQNELGDQCAADWLIIEDLQHLPATARLQLEQVLTDRGRRRQPTLLTANMAPAKLNIPARLADRMTAGLVVAVEPLSVASRKVILKYHSKTRRIKLGTDVLAWLAARPTGGSVRPLLGLLDTLAAAHRGRATAIDLAQVQAMTDAAAPGLDEIIRRVAQTYGVRERELLGASRLPRVLRPRQVAMFLARESARLPLPRIARHFRRDDSTVRHAVAKIRTAARRDQQLAGTIRQLSRELS